MLLGILCIYLWSLLYNFFYKRILRNKIKSAEVKNELFELNNFNKTYVNKIVVNYLSFIHSFMIIFSLVYKLNYNFNCNYLHYIITYISIGYFLYDINETIKNKITLENKIGFTLHHIISVYLLNYYSDYQSNNLYNLCIVYLLIELSNIILYYVQYLIIHRVQKYLLLFKNIEAILYTILRVPLLGLYLVKFLYNEYYNDDMSWNITLIFVLLYSMGLYWSYKLLRIMKFHYSINIIL